MSHFDVFNGDADGICALHQLRLADPRESTLVTGVKRDIALLKQVTASDSDSVTVLDISMEKNSADLIRLLEANVPVQYFDHHFPGDIPDNEKLSAHIDTDANVCTGLLVNKFLDSAHLPWAVVAAYGDNLHDSAKDAAKPLNLSTEQHAALEELGTLMNYNGYGSTIDDLYFAPDQLYKNVKPYADPFEFIASDQAFEKLKSGYESDMQKACAVDPGLATDNCAMFVFPQDAFARRVSGVYGNLLARDNPSRAHALLSTLPEGGYLVSVRAPLENKSGADELCRQFATGGGRKAAAGINHLPADDLSKFQDAFEAQFQGG